MNDIDRSKSSSVVTRKSDRNRDLIDASGLRPNVGMVVCNADGQVLLAKRFGQNAWQLPQGGVDAGETPEQAALRELNEEVGLTSKDVLLLGSTRRWLPYHLPSKFVKWHERPLFLGQKQKWFLFQLVSTDAHIRLDHSGYRPEFDGWKWVNYWYPIEVIIGFKREVYCQMLTELKPFLQNIQAQKICSVAVKA